MDSTVALIISISALLFSVLSPIVTAIINGHYSIKEKNLAMLSNNVKEIMIFTLSIEPRLLKLIYQLPAELSTTMTKRHHLISENVLRRYTYILMNQIGII